MCPVCLATMVSTSPAECRPAASRPIWPADCCAPDAINTPVIAFLASKPASYVTMAQCTMGGEVMVVVAQLRNGRSHDAWLPSELPTTPSSVSQRCSSPPARR